MCFTMSQNGTVLIVHERKFMALYIISVLEKSDFKVLASLSGLDEIEKLPSGEDPALCIIGSGTPNLSGFCTDLRIRFPASHLVLIDADGLDEMEMLAQDLGIDGCLSIDLAPPLLLAGLHLVAAGTRCFPKTDDADRKIETFRQQRPTLTPREKDVLALIGQGMANKVIARELDISESTVKAHLNAVLRKTGTTNRTQAARWSFENGQRA